MLNNLRVGRRLRPLLLTSLLAVAIIAYATALPTNWFRSSKVTGTIFSPPLHTWIVDDDGPAHFRKIQEAINAASSGDTIYVKAGIYYENVVVNKAILLRGESSIFTIIDGRRLDAVVYITADNVTVTEFTVQNSSAYPPRGGVYIQGSSRSRISNNNIVTNYWGIYLSSSLDNAISNNNITNNYGPVYLQSSNGSVVSHNNIENNDAGIGLHLSFNNIMSNNIIARNHFPGMNLYRSDGNLISNNDITNNRDGIFQYRSSSTVINNDIMNNEGYGVYLSSCFGNIIYHNNFINNVVQCDTTDSYDNVWDAGYPSGGNYWSNYVGVDLYSGPFQNVAGGDGVGDDSYPIDENNRDNYPLLSPHEYWSNPIPGDINRDKRVNYDDMFSLAVAYGSTPDKPNWNPSADVNHDGRINYKDLYKLAINYGKTYP